MPRCPRPRSLLAVLVAALAAALVPLGATAAAAAPAPTAAVTSLTNGTQFRDTAGNPMQAHGAGILQVGSSYYMVGENRFTDLTFKAVSMYRSTDLMNWEYRGDILTNSSATELNSSNIERPKLIYNAATRTFVLWMHWENGVDYGQARVAVATSPTVEGSYRYQGSFRPLGNDSRDMTVFVDDDASAYLLSSTRVNADLNIYRLDPTYTSVASLVQTVGPGLYREAPAVVKRAGVYFLLTSGATGWAPNQARYATATSMSGTFTAPTTVGNGITFGSQSTYIQTIQGTAGTSYLYLGDRWAPGWERPVNESEYVWLPLTFPTSTSMSMSWSRTISINTAAGTITTGGSGPGSGSAYSSLVARHSGKCADVPSSSRAQNVRVTQYTCNSGANQAWQILPTDSGFVTLTSRNSHLCLDVAGGSLANGAELIQYGCSGAAGQQFALVDQGGGFYALRARHSGKCLDVTGASRADGAQLIQFDCSGAANQQFTLGVL